jgi:hypothetical protein
MKFYFFLLLSLLTTALIGQEQITNVVGDGSSTRYILKEADGQKYIMATFPSDSIKVYKLVNGQSIFQYSRKFDGIYALNRYSTTDRFLLLSNGNGSIAYNFTNNSILEIPYEGSLEHTSWYYLYALGDEIILRQSTKDFAESKHLLCNLAIGQQRLLDSDLYDLKLGEEKIYTYKFASDTSYQLYVLDKQSLAIIDSTILPNLYANQSFFDQEKAFVYIKNKELKRYNFESKTHELLKIIDQPFKNISISYANEEYVVDLDQQGNHIVIRIDAKTLESSQFIIENEYGDISPNILYGKYLIFDFDLVVIDTMTGQKVKFPASTRNEGFVILENRYIVYQLDKQQLLLDLATMQNHILAEMPVRISARKLEIMSDNDIYLINFDNFSGNYQKLFEINLNTKKGAFSNKINGTNEGLIKGSKLIKIKNDIILVNSENLYLVNGSNAVKLNTNPLYRVRNTEIKIQNDVLYWSEYINDKYHIYTLKNGAIVKIASIPNLIGLPPYGLIVLYDYVVSPDAIYFANLGFDDVQYRFDLQTEVFTSVSNVESSEYFGIYHNEKYYYLDDKKISILRADGSKVSINVNTNFSFINPFFTFKNRLFYGNNDGLYEIVNDVLEQRVAVDDGILVNYFIQDDYIHINEYPDDYFYDGTSTYRIVSSINQYRGAQILDDYFVMYEGTGTNTTKASFLNYKTNTTINLPNEVAKLRDLKVFRNVGKYVVMGSDGFSLFHNVVLFETDENFSYFTKIKEFDVTSNGVISSFTEYVNEGFLYTGNVMYLMDTLLNFISIDGLAGENQSSAVFEQDGYFYFIALHPTNGRQLFRIQPFSRRTSVYDESNILTKVIIYPNPSKQEIYFDGDEYSAAEIYNLDGHLINQSTLNDGNKLNINGLKNGIYVVILSSTAGQKSIGKFIKVD